MTTVAFCISTFRRPHGLARLLDSIGALTVPEGVEVRIVVVDNDAAGSASDVVTRFAATVPWPVHSVIETRRGIPMARNRSIAEAGDADVFSFVDDDEELAPDWLATGLRVLQEHDAEAVVTPVVAAFEEEPPPWIVRGGFFDRPRFRTGERVESWAMDSGASLVRRRAFSGDHAGFDPGFLTGSDRLFFTKLERTGAKMVWADDTFIREFHPASRTSTRWLVRRAYRTGNVRSLVTLAVEAPGLYRRFRRACYGLYQLVAGVVQLVTAGRARDRSVRALQRAANGLGLITGIAGMRFNEYRVVHGT